MFMWTASILCLLNFVVVSLINTVGCSPVQASWDVAITDGKCVNAMEYVNFCYYAAGAFPLLLSGIHGFVQRYSAPLESFGLAW